MSWFPPENEDRFRALWESVSIRRRSPYNLFTFGESDLPYFLVVPQDDPAKPVEVSQGNVKVRRPMIVTPQNATPELQNLFDDDELSDFVQFLMSRSAAFSHLKIDNQARRSEFYSDSVDEIVARLTQQLDDEEEDRVAILTAPHKLGKIAVLRYTTESILESAPGNIQELKERGFLPE